MTKNYYKVGQVLQSVKVVTMCDRMLLQSVAGITKCDRKLLKRATSITKWDVTQPSLKLNIELVIAFSLLKKCFYNSSNKQTL